MPDVVAGGRPAAGPDAPAQAAGEPHAPAAGAIRQHPGAGDIVGVGQVALQHRPRQSPLDAGRSAQWPRSEADGQVHGNRGADVPADDIEPPLAAGLDQARAHHPDVIEAAGGSGRQQGLGRQFQNLGGPLQVHNQPGDVRAVLLIAAGEVDAVDRALDRLGMGHLGVGAHPAPLALGAEDRSQALPGGRGHRLLSRSERILAISVPWPGNRA